MTSFGATINTLCPWAVDLSYKFSLETQQPKKIEWEALGSMQRSVGVTERVVCVFVYNLKVRCKKPALDNSHYFPIQRVSKVR